jgi:hypothetical protein
LRRLEREKFLPIKNLFFAGRSADPSQHRNAQNTLSQAVRKKANRCIDKQSKRGSGEYGLCSWRRQHQNRLSMWGEAIPKGDFIRLKNIANAVHILE